MRKPLPSMTNLRQRASATINRRRLLKILLVVAMIPVTIMATPQLAAAQDITITSSPPAASVSRDATFEFQSATTSEFECEIDGFPFEPCASPKSYTGLLNADHTFRVRPVGGGEGDTVSYSWTVDDGTPNQTRRWFLENVRFDSGATASGSFDYNPLPFAPLAGQYGVYSNINIDVTSPDGSVREFRAVNRASRGNAAYVSFVAATGEDQTGAPFMALTPATEMTTAGGVIEILPGPQNLSYLGTCRNANCGPADSPYEELVTGQLISKETWYLENVRFDSGATASGSFDYNPLPFAPLAGQYGVYSNINVDVTSPDGSVREFRAVNRASRGNARYVSFVAATGEDQTGAPFMALTPATDMTAAGGVIEILPGPQNLSYLGTCRNANCGPADSPYEELVTGRLSTAPSPSITSAADVSVPENQTAVIDLNASDPDGDTEGNGLTYSISGGADQAAFGVEAGTGVVTFAEPPDFEIPIDAGGDNVFNVTVTVTDSDQGTGSIDLVITVTNVADDVTAPTAAPTQDPQPNAAGWNNGDITVTWNWSDEAGGAGIDPQQCEPQTVVGDEGEVSVTSTCADLDGNVGTAEVGVRIDRTPPATSITDSPAGTDPDGAVTLTFNGLDSVSGVAGFECSLSDGAAIETQSCTSPVDYTGLADGDYLFSVVSIDAAGNVDPTPATSTWTVQRPPANTAPVVEAGPAQTITLPNTAPLAGSVTDDGLPGPPNQISAMWEQVSGPGDVTFADATSVSTDASFSAAGTYVLRLTGDDGELTASDDVTITVDAAPVVCEPGSYLADPADASCTPAGPGYFVPEPGATEQIPCEVGSYSDGVGAVACTFAPAGFFVDTAAAVAPTPCELGSFNAGTGASSCDLADIGFYVDAAAAAAQTPCPPGTTTAAVGSTSVDDCVTTSVPIASCGGFDVFETSTGEFEAPGFTGNLIVGDERRNVLRGTSDSDLILGLGGPDLIYGRRGNDVICGGDGADRIFGARGDDRLFGDAGNDRLFGQAGADELSGGDDNDRLSGQSGADILRGGLGIDILQGGSGNDRLFGDAGNDRLFGQAGADELDGGDNDDRCYGGRGTDSAIRCERVWSV